MSLEIRRAEVTTLLSRHDQSAGQLLDLLDGRATASWGSVVRHERAIDQITEALELGGMLGYHDAPGADERRARWAVARNLVGGPALLLVDHVSAAGGWPDKPGLMVALRLATHELRVAAVVATRDPWTAAATDRVVRLNRGKVLDDTGAL